MQENYWST